MDELMDRYIELNNRTVFDPHTFWQEWLTLADDFGKAGRPLMASGCYGKSDWYKGVGKGYAQRLTYHEITSVQADYVVRKDEHILPCVNCETETKHVKCVDGWACACGELVS